MTPEQQAIVKSAQEAGENPAYALAVAERESSFNPMAHSSKTIHGMYQMRGDLRQKYGVGDSEEPEDQARGWIRSLPDIRAAMAKRIGRQPTDPEVYLGHHYGPGRAAQTLKMDPSTPVEAVFTPDEMRGNPHFAKAGTIGRLNSSVTGDIDRRMAKYGNVSPAPTSTGSTQPAAPSTRVSQALPEQAPDLSQFGEAVESPAAVPQQVASLTPAPPDLSSFGTAVAA